MIFKIDEIPCKRSDNGKSLYLTRCSSRYTDPGGNILIVHGLTVSQHIFDVNYKDYSLARQFAKSGYTVWRLDIGGYGQSETYDNGFDVTTENASKDIIAAMETINEIQGFQKVYLMGWSWGTMTTAMAAAARPDLVEKLVWIAPCTGGTLPVIETTEDKMAFTYEYAARLFQHENSGAAEASSANSDPSVSHDEIDYEITEREVCGIVLQYVFKHDCVERPNGGARELYSAGDKYLLDGTSIKVPTAILKGTLDVYSNQERCDKLMRELPEGSELHVFRGAGHALYLEKDYHTLFQNAVVDFLNK